MEKILEGVAFRSAVPMAVEGHKISPWIHPACRAQTVLNTEVHKGKSNGFIIHHLIEELYNCRVIIIIYQFIIVV